MQTEIEQAELQLTQDKQRGLIVFRRQHFIQQFFRQRFAGLKVTGDKCQRIRLPAPVFHELAWQFDRIPWHTADTGNARRFDAGQHVVQAVTKLMEQGNHFVMGEERRFAFHRTVKVTGQVSNGLLQAAIGFTHLADTVIHPSTASFMLAGVEVEIEAAAQFAGFIKQIEELHVRMINLNVGTLLRSDAVNAFHHFEQTSDRARFREIRAQLLIADGVEMLLLLFTVIGEIPRIQLLNAMLFLREGAQLLQLFFTLRTRAFSQVIKEVDDLRRALRHFGRQRFIRVGVEAQQLSQLVTQRQLFRHDGAIVPFTGVRTLIGGACRIGAIHLFAQRRVVAVGHDWQVAWNIQRQQPAFLLFSFSLGFCRRQCAFRHTGQLAFIGDQLAPAHSGIKHVVAVSRPQLREARGDFAIALLFIFWQTDTGEFEITQGVIDRFLLRQIQCRVLIALFQVAIRLIQPFMLTDPGAVLREQRQRLFISFTQLRAVFYRIKMADRGENTAQAIVGFRQRLNQVIPGIGRTLRHHFFDFCAALAQHFRHGRHHMFRLDGRKRGKRKRCQ